MAVKDLAGEDLADETGMKEGNEFGMNEKTRVGVVPPAFLAVSLRDKGESLSIRIAGENGSFSF